jgi:hypothetical protein
MQERLSRGSEFKFDLPSGSENGYWPPPPTERRVKSDKPQFLTWVQKNDRADVYRQLRCGDVKWGTDKVIVVRNRCPIWQGFTVDQAECFERYLLPLVVVLDDGAGALFGVLFGTRQLEQLSALVVAVGK